MRVVVVVVFLLFPSVCDGHGYLLVPPQRSSFWRERSGMPVNYSDNQLNCGGYHTQFYLNGGKCGTCGDPYRGPWPNQPPDGKYATGTISRCYKSGTTHIDVKMVLTANHKGTIQLRLCPNNNVNVPVTQGCLDSHLLQLENINGPSLGTTYRVVQFEKVIEFRARLPKDILCSQCVLQWTYVAGNNWGCDGSNCGPGFGHQENFVNCADIAILNECPVITTTTPSLTTNKLHLLTTTPNTPINFVPQKWVPPKKWIPKVISPKDWAACVGANAWTGQWKMDRWCRINCPMGYCPSTHCFCPKLKRYNRH